MKIRFSFAFSLVLLLASACGSRSNDAGVQEAPAEQPLTVATNDSVVCGLVCDGLTDTLLVFLPLDNISSDPDTFNILEANRQHKMFGQLRIGDKVAVVCNRNDSTVADMVIDLDNLHDRWCYQVLPTLHQRADMDGGTEAKKLAGLPDSIRQLLSVPREYFLQINSDNTVMAFSNRPSVHNDGINVLDYPRLKHYRYWHLSRELLVLDEITTDTLGNPHLAGSDTARFVMLGQDTLVLRFADGLRHFYAKKEE